MKHSISIQFYWSIITVRQMTRFHSVALSKRKNCHSIWFFCVFFSSLIFQFNIHYRSAYNLPTAHCNHTVSILLLIVFSFSSIKNSIFIKWHGIKNIFFNNVAFYINHESNEMKIVFRVCDIKNRNLQLKKKWHLITLQRPQKISM